MRGKVTIVAASFLLLVSGCAPTAVDSGATPSASSPSSSAPSESPSSQPTEDPEAQARDLGVQACEVLRDSGFLSAHIDEALSQASALAQQAAVLSSPLQSLVDHIDATTASFATGNTEEQTAAIGQLTTDCSDLGVVLFVD